MHEVIYGFQKKIPKKYSKGLATVVKKLLQKDPEKRPDMARLLTYRYTI
jgi:Ca2+-binding EF-hand superfamily protein